MEKELLIQLFIHNGEVCFDDEQQKPVSDLLPETIRHYGDVNADCILVNISALDDEGKEKICHELFYFHDIKRVLLLF